jgi:hypothetical protein
MRGCERTERQETGAISLASRPQKSPSYTPALELFPSPALSHRKNTQPTENIRKNRFNIALSGKK